MSRFERLPDFDKELAKLSRKYRSLPEDIAKLERFISVNPVRLGTNFVTIHYSSLVRIVKARLACKSLRDRSMRIIYAYHEQKVAFVHIEIYFKGDKENEDRGRIESFMSGR